MGTKLVKALNTVVEIIAIAFIIAMLCVVCANVVMRYFLRSPITGAAEITQMLMICMTACMAPALMRGQHVWIDLVTSKFNRVASIILDLITIAASAFIYGMISNGLFRQMIKSMAKNKRYSLLKLPEWPFLMIFGVATMVLAISMIIYLVDRMIVYAKGKTPTNEFSGYANEKTMLDELADETTEGGEVK